MMQITRGRVFGWLGKVLRVGSLSSSLLVLLAVLAGAALAARGHEFEKTFGEGCPNEQFRQGFSAGLPDCRAYELVSLVFRNIKLVVVSKA
jgi:hypothetical protein